MHLYEFGDFVPLPASVDADAFRAYLARIWDRRQDWYEFPDRPEEETGEVFGGTEQGFLRFAGPYVQAQNYTGIIHYQGQTLCLFPKLFRPDAAAPERIFRHVGFYAAYSRSLRAPWLWQRLMAGNPERFLPEIIHYFAVLAGKTLAEQPLRVYQETEETASVLRGQLQIPEYARNYLSTGQWQSMPARYTPFTYDNAFNQIVKFTLQLVSPQALPESRPHLQHMHSLLDEVSLRAFTYADCEGLNLPSLREDHRQLLELCRFFLLHAPPLHQPEAPPGLGWLLPTERLFEDFVAGFLLTHFPEVDVRTQSTQPFARTDTGAAMSIRNDIWLPAQAVVIDTKYKLLNASAGIPSPDLYQMLAYATAREVPEVHLIYPLAGTGSGKSQVITLSNSPATRPVRIHVHQLPVIAPDTEDIAAYLQPQIYQILATIIRGA